jgi:potassium/hydrogen antiporter
VVTIEQTLLVTSALLLAGVFASKASSRSGVPALLLFLGIGMLAGSEGPGGIPFDDANAAQSLGVVALSLILFHGGLETEWRSISPVLWRGLSLSTVGVLLTAGMVGGAAAYLFDLPYVEGLLLGAIVSSTDAAAVFSVLRSRGSTLRGTTKPLLELESGSNDPMAVFLTLATMRLIEDPSSSIGDLAGMFALQMSLGGGIGYLMGRASRWLINHIRLEADGLYPVLSLALAWMSYGASSLAGGNGFLAVYIAGIVLGKGDFIHKRSLLRFHDGVAWLMQIAMFLSLGLLVFPSHLIPVAGSALAISFFLMFVARPVAVFVALAAAKMRGRQRLMIAWVGLRGAVPIILATFPLMQGFREAETLFNVVFFIVLTSVLLQGTTLNAAAARLGLSRPMPPARQYPLEFVPTPKTDSAFLDVAVAADSPAAGKQIVDLNLPDSALILLVGRGEAFLTPRGATVLEAGDSLLLLVRGSTRAEVRELFEPGQAAADDDD